MRKCDLIAPVSGVLGSWSMLLFQGELGRPSKINIFGDSVLLDDPRTTLGVGQPGSASCPKWCLHMRQGGPSTDLADRARTLVGAQRCWASPKSVHRYERHLPLAEWS